MCDETESAIKSLCKKYIIQKVCKFKMADNKYKKQT